VYWLSTAPIFRQPSIQRNLICAPRDNRPAGRPILGQAPPEVVGPAADRFGWYDVPC